MSRAALAAGLLAWSASGAAAQVAPRPVTDRVVAVNGVKLHYQETGAGPPLVLLHGYGGCIGSWGALIDELAATHRVIAIDLPGHGRSTTARAHLSLRQWSRDVLALLAKLEARPVRAIGVGTGAMTLLHMAAQAPDRVEAMVLVGGAAHWTEAARARAHRFKRLAELPPPVADAYRRCATGARPEQQIAALLIQLLTLTGQRDDLPFTRDALGGLRPRVLVVAGDRDPLFPVELQVELYRALPRAHLWVVPGADPARLDDAFGPQLGRATADFFAGAWEPETVRLR